MKKILIVIIIAFAAAVAQAQSPKVEVNIADAGFKGLLAQQKPAAKGDTLCNAVERKVGQRVADKQAQAKNKKAVAPAKVAAKVTTPASQKDSQKSVASQRRATAIQLMKSIFLGGPLPGESVEAYHHRLSAQAYAATQPYK